MKRICVMTFDNIWVIYLAQQGVSKVTSAPPTALVLEEVNTSRLTVSPLA